MTEVKTTAENPGTPFRVAREKSGLSISDVAVATKINPRILKALEEGNKEELPAHSFARGFIRSYAAYLKIASQPILDAYALSNGTAAPHINTDADLVDEMLTQPKLNPQTSSKHESQPPSVNVSNSGPTSRKKRISLSRSTNASKGLLVISMLIVVGIAFGIKSIFDKYAQERVIEPNEITATIKNENRTQTTPATETKTGQSESAVLAAPTTSNAIPEEAIQAARDTIVQNQQNSEAITSAKNENLPEIKVEPATTSPEKKTESTSAAKPTTPQEVIIEALDDVEFTVRIDNGSSQKVRLKPENIHTVKANSEIQLDIKDGGTVNIVHNGRDRGVPGDLGKPIKLKFP